MPIDKIVNAKLKENADNSYLETKKKKKKKLPFVVIVMVSKYLNSQNISGISEKLWVMAGTHAI